jgi:hypothetical protein
MPDKLNTYVTLQYNNNGSLFDLGFVLGAFEVLADRCRSAA